MSYSTLAYYKIFIVVDNPMYQHLLSNIIETDDRCKVYTFESGQQSLLHLKMQPDIVLVDVAMSDIKIDRFCTEIKKYDSRIEIITLLEKENSQLALSLLQQGVYDYILKDGDLKNRCTSIVGNLYNKISILRTVRQLNNELNERFTLSPGVRNSSDTINDLLKLARKASQSNINVIMTGEVGTDKIEIAKRIHYNSARKLCPFIVVDLNASDEDQVEMELFGYEVKTIGDLSKKKIGLIEEANGGTIYLDNINLISDKLQRKLLRLIRDNSIHLTDTQQTLVLDVRYIVGTTKSLMEEVKNGRFRAELYYQLMGLNIHVKPLRERKQDIVLLADYYLDKFCKDNGIPFKKITSGAADKLMQYPFPGNLNELKGIIRMAAVLADSDVVTEDHIQFNNTRTVHDFFRKEITMKDYKKFIVQYYLEMYNDDIPLIAKKLDIGTATIYRMRKEWKKNQ